MLMTRFLASVRDADEAALALDAGADIIDLKDPANGALGAVAPDVARACVARVAGRARISATVGDLPMDAGVIAPAVADMAASGVDDVKLGVSSGGDPERCFTALRRLDMRAGLILVFFADAMPPLDPVAAARVAHARGVMLDTAGKGEGALPDYMASNAIAHFVETARAGGLVVGLAGALRARHVPALLALRPDVLGFRGALCREGQRCQALNPDACRRMGALIREVGEPAPTRFQAPQASALC